MFEGLNAFFLFNVLEYEHGVLGVFFLFLFKENFDGLDVIRLQRYHAVMNAYVHV